MGISQGFVTFKLHSFKKKKRERGGGRKTRKKKKKRRSEISQACDRFNEAALTLEEAADGSRERHVSV